MGRFLSFFLKIIDFGSNFVLFLKYYRFRFHLTILIDFSTFSETFTILDLRFWTILVPLMKYVLSILGPIFVPFLSIIVDFRPDFDRFQSIFLNNFWPNFVILFLITLKNPFLQTPCSIVRCTAAVALNPHSLPKTKPI